MITAAVVIVCLMFSVYMWMASIEFGIALLRLWPRLDTGKLVNKLFTPMWEVTNVFLVFGFTGFAVLFNNALVPISHAVLPTLAVGVTALLLRGSIVLYLFYYRPKEQGLTPGNAAFALANFLVPASFTAVGVYLLTGQAFWLTASGWSLMAMAISLFAAMGWAFVYLRAGHQAGLRLQWLARACIALFALIGSIGVQLVVSRDAPHLLTLTFSVVSLLAAFSILWQGALLTTRRADHGMWWYLSAVSLAMPLLMAFANRPWLVYGQHTLEQAYGAQAYGMAVLLGLGAIFPVMAIGWGLLAWLLTHDKPPTSGASGV